VSAAPRDDESYRFPVSVKGVVIRGGRVVLLENERDEWELPGGKLEPSESPQGCVVREIFEELGLRVAAERLLDTWVYAITDRVRVLILTWGCRELDLREAVSSREHKRLGWFGIDEVERLPMPAGYKDSIRAWAGHAPEPPAP
jgi:8-oxo-dGTP pyrophosphatase MutT (NUDIX family)